MNSPLHSVPASASPIAREGELVSRAAAGDEAAFEVLMRRHNQLLFRTARSILKSDAEAEDAVQEAYLRAWRALASFRAESRLSTWLARIVTNEALGRLRRTGAQVIPLEAAMTSPDPETQAALTDAPERGPEQSTLRSQVRKIMETRIDLLPEVYRTVFVLRAVEEMSVEDVARALDIPEATVRTRFFRARSLLRESLVSEMDMALGEVFAFDGARCDRIVANVLGRGRAQGLSNADR
jgi:RNA polymerase sigma-70 factor (ECF subfamily)